MKKHFFPYLGRSSFSGNANNTTSHHVREYILCSHLRLETKRRRKIYHIVKAHITHSHFVVFNSGFISADEQKNQPSWRSLWVDGSQERMEQHKEGKGGMKQSNKPNTAPDWTAALPASVNSCFPLIPAFAQYATPRDVDWGKDRSNTRNKGSKNQGN